jgi:hypothetical protein
VRQRRPLTVGTVLATGLALAMTGSTWLPQAAAASGGGPPVAPALGRAASGGAVIVVLRDQHTNLNLRTQAAKRTAAAHADQRSIVASIKASGGTGVLRLVAPSAVAAHVPAAEVSRLRRNPAVAGIVPDVPVHMQPPGSAPAPLTSAVPVPRRSAAAKAAPCPFNPAGPARPLQEPEAVADVHASDGNPSAPDMANSIATGKGVIIANDGMDQLAGNPNFTRPSGTHVIIDAPSYKADHGNAESYGDASSMAAQGTVTYQYAKALPYSPVPPGCAFYIKGDAPGASLVDLTKIDTPILMLSKVIAGIDRVVATVHADVISESFGLNSVPPSSFGNLLAQANEAAVEAGVTVVESSGDSGSSGTVIAASDDPQVIAAGAVDNFRLVAMNDGYPSYESNQMAALSSGGTAPTGKVVNLVAPGWYGGEAACADNSGGCPPDYPTEAMRGTSEAAPLIAGAAADVIQAYRDTHRGTSPTPQVVQEILSSTATDLDNPADQQGAGLLNVYAAVKAAQQMPGTTDTGGPGDSPGLVVSPWQLDVAGSGGSVQRGGVIRAGHIEHCAGPGKGPAQPGPGQRGGDTLASPRRVDQNSGEVVASRSCRACLPGWQLDDPPIAHELPTGLGDEHLPPLVGDIRGELLPAVTGLHPQNTYGEPHRGRGIRLCQRFDPHRGIRHALRPLPAERGPGCGCGGAEVLGWFDEAPLVECRAVGEGAPVAETGEVERADVHDRLEPAEFVAGRLDVPAVGADGRVDPLLVRPAWVPCARAPDQVSEVGEARPAPGRFPVDRDRPLFGQDGVIGGVEEVSVEQALREAVTVVGRAYLVAQPFESRALAGRDLRVDGVEKRQGGQQVLTRRALAARVLTAGPARAADRIVKRQRVQPSEQLTHHGELRGTVGERGAVDEPRYQDRAAIEVRYRIADRQALRGIVMPLQEPQDRRVALDTGTRPGRRERTGDPRAAVVAVDAEHVRLVHTELGRRDRVNAVTIPQMGEEPLSCGLVVHSPTEALEIGQRFGVALPSLRGVAPDNLLEAGVLGHRQASP